MFGAISRGSRLARVLTASLLVAGRLVHASGYTLDMTSEQSVKDTAKGLADDMLSFYSGNKPGGTPGLLPSPYYWWEAGAMLGALIDYWYYTGDDEYNDLVSEGLLFQVGTNRDYMPNNQTLTEGNDDQGFWGLAVMSAAEYNFPNPPADKPQWLELAQAVFNTQAARWDTADCNGGLRWQIYQWNKGYDYKNSISQACFFALGARLALYTGNQTYADWAERTWDWMWGTGFINNETYYVIDGAAIGSNCTTYSPYQFSYNAGGFILGAAAMYNHTESKAWKDRLDGLIKGSQVFFVGDNNDIMSEVACEPVDRCNIDQQSFKAYLSRWLAAATQWAPDVYDTVMPYLKASAKAAVNQCVGGDNGRMCGLKWARNEGKYDGSTGVGQQMAALEVLLATTIKDRAAPLTADSGGTSKGDPNAGSSDIGKKNPIPTFDPPTAGMKAAAAFITMAILSGILGAVAWLLFDETSDKKIVAQVKGSIANFKSTMAGGAAAGAGVGVVGAAARGRRSSPVDEKGVQTTTGYVSDRSSHISEKAMEDMPVTVNRVRRDSSNSTRRLSNMPLGWPRNSVARPGLVGQAVTTDDADRIEPVNPRHSRT
ncbi:hypothetical protein LMH87_004699 [Akanthomyces muscarius]|uniref:mannan endo-1,6-alpha-mannosidase n=1 Tax=Akanthomyces muscarius TaxID=2231603 RepID=A0A9W8Q6Z9_AKAMU|nr:hypothetical protein LMH87_004699 [Akanthomyces muscarius]KAJ4145867.1 hypothetical protein LMH87_004699 [Akanthomyces muscarius]